MAQVWPVLLSQSFRIACPTGWSSRQESHAALTMWSVCRASAWTGEVAASGTAAVTSTAPLVRRVRRVTSGSSVRCVPAASGVDEFDELHHALVLVREAVAVQDGLAGEVLVLDQDLGVA